MLACSILISCLAPMIGAVTFMTDDEFLTSVGVPQDVLEKLSDEQKSFIREDLEPNARFRFYQEYGNEEEVQSITRAGNNFDTIPSSRFSVTVAGFEITANGIAQYAVYPSYQYTPQSTFSEGLLGLYQDMRNDAFVVSLYPGWEISGSGTPNLRVKYTGSTGEKTLDISPLNATSVGYEFRIDDEDGIYAKEGTVVKGNATFRMIRVDSNASLNLNLRYVEDNKSGNSKNDFVSYTVTINEGGSSINCATFDMGYLGTIAINRNITIGG